MLQITMNKTAYLKINVGSMLFTFFFWLLFFVLKRGVGRMEEPVIA